MSRLAMAMLVFIAFLNALANVNAMRADESADRMTATQTATLVRSVIETVLQEHIAPPTRQQMVVEFICGFARVHEKPASLDLSKIVSDARGPEELYGVLTTELKRTIESSVPTKEVQTTIQSTIGRMILGGLDFESRKNVLAEEQIAANRYVGIGVVLSAEDASKGMQFTKILEDGTAAEGGIVDKDFLDSVDGKSTKKLPLGEVIQLLRGPIDTVVTVEVRTNNEPARTLKLVRRVIPLKSLELIETNIAKKALLVRVDRFSASSINELQNLVTKAEKGGVKFDTVVLDMQNTIVDNLHYFHLFADGILDAAELCQVQTRKGIRTLKTEDGKVLEDRRVAILYPPRKSEALDLFAKAIELADSHAYYWFPDLTPKVAQPTSSNQIRGSIEVPGTEFFMKTVTSRLLDGNGLAVSTFPGMPTQDIIGKALVKFEGSTLDLILNESTK